MEALARGHRKLDAARDVQAMNATRVAFHASRSETEAWIKGQSATSASQPKPEDLRAGWRASLEALGIMVED